MASMLRTSCVIGTPSTMMSPLVFLQTVYGAMKVDFPDPDGPTMTTLAPRSTEV